MTHDQETLGLKSMAEKYTQAISEINKAWEKGPFSTNDMERSFIVGTQWQCERILEMLRTFSCVAGKRMDAKSAFQLADWLEEKLK